MNLTKDSLLLLLLQPYVVAQHAQPLPPNSQDQPTCKDEVIYSEPEAEENIRERFPSRELFFNDWGKPQILDEGEGREATLKNIQETEKYMKEHVNKEELYKPVRGVCINMNSKCSLWAAQGSCNEEEILSEDSSDDEGDYMWMIENCSPACQTCELREGEYEEPSIKEEVIQEKEMKYPMPAVGGLVEEKEGIGDHEVKDSENYEEKDSEDGELEEEEWESEEEEEDSDDFPNTSGHWNWEFLDWNLEEEDLGEFEPSIWGYDQNLGIENAEEVRAIVEESHEYMIEKVYHEKFYENVTDRCENKYIDCSLWANEGACTGPEAPLMRFRCPVACQTCEVLEYKHRCPIDRDHDWVLKKPGDLNAIFERISTDPFWKDHGPIDIISSPETGGPWLITLDNFISDEECERLIELGGEEGYERSLDFDDVTDDGSSTHIESTGRTSTNAWCPERCNTDPISGPVHRRIEKLVGSNYNNSENIQLLSYTSGQFYEAHHDYLPIDNERPYGPRILTIYLYLADVEKGGGTKFNKLDKVVMPKRGRAVIWPSVLDESPWDKDERTMHEALPVEAGRKYGANAWVHLGDFKTASDTFCT